MDRINPSPSLRGLHYFDQDRIQHHISTDLKQMGLFLFKNGLGSSLKDLPYNTISFIRTNGIDTIATTSEAGGSIIPGTTTISYGADIELTTIPDSTYRISDVIVDGKPIGPLSKYTLPLVSASHSIDVIFDTEKTLTITKTGEGKGRIISNPRGISCGTDCKQIYDTDDLVLLIPKPSSHSVFVGWSGGGCSGTDTCTVKMDDDITVEAIFSLK